MAEHVGKVIGGGNGGSPWMRGVCSCGWLGTRFAYNRGPGAVKEAKAKAQADIDGHVSGSQSMRLPRTVP